VPNGLLSSQYVHQGWEWERTHLLICVYEWERELTSLPPFRPITRQTNLLANRILDGWTNKQIDEHTRFSAETLNLDTPKRIPITLRGYPVHWVMPIPWVICLLTDCSHDPPKSLPITLWDPGFLTNKPDTEWYPLHWGIPLTLSDTHYPEFFFYISKIVDMKCCNSVCCTTKFETNYSSCTVRSSENLCSSSGGAQEKGKTGWNSIYHQNWWFSEFHPHLDANVLFCRFFLNLTLCMAKLRVLVLCFSSLRG
jgi:hypothetical protein